MIRNILNKIRYGTLQQFTKVIQRIGGNGHVFSQPLNRTSADIKFHPQGIGRHSFFLQGFPQRCINNHNICLPKHLAYFYYARYNGHIKCSNIGHIREAFLVGTFFGHRDAPQTIRNSLKLVLIDLIENKNVTMFYVGNNIVGDGALDVPPRSTYQFITPSVVSKRFVLFVMGEC